MSQNLIANFWKLQAVANAKSKTTRAALLSEFAKDINFCKAIREIAKNTVRQKLKLPAPAKRKLRKHRKLIFDLQKKRLPHTKRKKLLQQTGSGVLIPILVPLVAQIISNLLQ